MEQKDPPALCAVGDEQSHFDEGTNEPAGPSKHIATTRFPTADLKKQTTIAAGATVGAGGRGGYILNPARHEPEPEHPPIARLYTGRSKRRAQGEASCRRALGELGTCGSETVGVDERYAVGCPCRA